MRPMLHCSFWTTGSSGRGRAPGSGRNPSRVFGRRPRGPWDSAGGDASLARRPPRYRRGGVRCHPSPGSPPREGRRRALVSRATIDPAETLLVARTIRSEVENRRRPEPERPFAGRNRGRCGPEVGAAPPGRLRVGSPGAGQTAPCRRRGRSILGLERRTSQGRLAVRRKKNAAGLRPRAGRAIAGACRRRELEPSNQARTPRRRDPSDGNGASPRARTTPRRLGSRVSRGRGGALPLAGRPSATNSNRMRLKI